MELIVVSNMDQKHLILKFKVKKNVLPQWIKIHLADN